jgi:extracellular factor (EF) 3-hydroxypalmitic acid methyl ester biosynthesis protein
MDREKSNNLCRSVEYEGASYHNINMSLTYAGVEMETAPSTALPLPSDLLRSAIELEGHLRSVQGMSSPKPAEAQRLHDSILHTSDILERLSSEERTQYSNPLQEMLLPLFLGSPFAKRSFEKPLGYAGDYEMVNMILSNEPTGATGLGQNVDSALLISPPSVAHRNRIQLLKKLMDEAAERAVSSGRKCRALNVGCGPAAEIQRFIRDNPLAEKVSFTLVDFNAETLEFAEEKIREAAEDAGRKVDVSFRNISVYPNGKPWPLGRG